MLLDQTTARAAPRDAEIAAAAAGNVVLRPQLAAAAHLQDALQPAAGEGVPAAALGGVLAYGLFSFGEGTGGDLQRR